MAVAPDHAELSEQLNAYLDRALDDVTRRRLERHLAACAACRLDLEQLRATRDALRSLPQLEAPRSFAIALPAPENARVAPPVGVTSAALAAPASTRQPAPSTAVARPWLAWTWRLGSLGAAACLLLAVVTSTVTTQAPGTAATFGAPASAPAGGAPAGPPASLANRDSAQRTSPAAPAPAQEAQSGQAQSAARPQQPAQAPQASPGDQAGIAPAPPAAQTGQQSDALSGFS
ncbi:MAG TPA: anti-sigma factor, partial [Chloroflexota bacterium]|nr:anti-sigma factor [Chloroflexota bacterium]